MTQLLSVEWLKVRRYRTFWIIIGLFAFLFPVANYMIGKGLFAVELSDMVLGSEASFVAIWYNTCYYGGHFLIFISLLVAILVSNEYQFRTNRQNIIDGWSRSSFLMAKWQLVVGLALATTAFTGLAGIFEGLIRGASISFVGNGIENLGWFFIECVNYYGFGLVIALLLRRAGLAIIIMIAYYMIVDNLAHSYFVYELKFQQIDFMLPLEASDELFPVPYKLYTENQFSKQLGIHRLDRWSYAVASAAWITLYYIIGRIRLLKSDW